MLTPDEISRLYDIRDVTGSGKTKIICPLPDHRHFNYTPSFNIYFEGGKQRWYCHGCGRGGDVIDLVGYLNIPAYNSADAAHIKRAINILTNGKVAVTPVIPPPPRPDLIYQGEWKKFFPPGPGGDGILQNPGDLPQGGQAVSHWPGRKMGPDLYDHPLLSRWRTAGHQAAVGQGLRYPLSISGGFPCRPFQPRRRQRPERHDLHGQG
jgi:hypothetical protein